MKKNYLRIKAIAFLCASVFTAGAQLSGVYTINSASVTGGTNYQSFNDFANDVNTNGVSGPVNVNVVTNSGPYVEQVLFNQISGASSFNRITINGNGNLLTFNSSNSSLRHVIGLNGTDWMNINDLNVEGTGSYAYVLLMYGGADNNIFSSCTFSAPANASSSNQIPVVVSGSSTTYGSASNSGSNNTWNECEMFSGYFGISMYGPTGVGTYMTGNKVNNCSIRDFYYYGLYLYYQDKVTITGNIVEKPTRTTLTSSSYGIYATQTTGSLFEGNTVRKLFEQNQTLSGTCYCYYIVGNSNSTYNGEPTIIRNNIATDIKWNGSIYGFMTYYTKGDFIHNTLCIEHPTSTGGTVYGLYYVTTNGMPVNSANNIVYINKGGSSSKYGVYYSSTSLVSSDNNDIWVGGSGSNNYAGYYSGAQTSLANLQTVSGQEAQTYSIDPLFANMTLNDLTPTATSLNNLATPYNVIFDHNLAVRNQITPDHGAIEFLTPLCSGTPSANGVSAPNYAICPGENVDLGLSTLNPDAGFSYQWQSSGVSNVGPFTPIVGATNLFYTAPNVTTTTWYSVIMTCTVPGGGSISPVAQVMVAGPTTSAVPYYEGFEGIGKTNRLPNCSWTASDLGSSNQTYTNSGAYNRVPNSGTSFAAFSNASPGTSYFYTNPIQMNSGITYSAALYYATEYFGYSNWTDLSIFVGPNQSTTGLVQVASVGPAISGPYKLLDNTFTVPTSGLYYVAIRATSSTGSALYLSFDDLSITIPCEPGSPNSPTVSLNASTGTICAGQAVNLSAGGADSYLWSTGATGASIAEYPATSTTFYVYGTNALTGCTSTLSQAIMVNPSPTVFIIANNPVVCAGKQVILSAYGANSYMWSNSATGAFVTVTPGATTSYTVVGVNAAGCSSSYVQQIVVNSLPVVTAISGNPDACKDDQITLSANGALTYLWASNADPVIYQGTSINVSAQVSTIFTVTGTNANGCSNIATIAQNISACTGLAKHSANSPVRVFPNPTAGELNLDLGGNTETLIEVSDITGRTVLSNTASDEFVKMDISKLANGVYYLKFKSANGSEVIKIVKQ